MNRRDAGLDGGRGRLDGSPFLGPVEVLDAEGIQARSAEHHTQITCAGSGRGCGTR